MKLNDATIKGLELPPGKSDAIFFDDDPKARGFGIRLRAGCKPIFIFQYRAGSKQRRMTIAKVEKLGTDAARKRARELAAEVVLGRDPQTAKAEQKVEKANKEAAAKHTVGALVEVYLEDREKSGELRPNTLADIRRYLRSHWKPLHKLQVDDVERVSIAALLRTIAKESGATAAARARSALQSFFAWAMAEGFSLANASPVIGTRPPKTGKPRERFLCADEIREVWRACRDDDHGRIVRLLLLTGARRGEIGGLKWSEIDLEKAVIELPPERTKNGRPHAIPLAPLALQIIKSTPKRAGRDLLFGYGARGFGGWHLAGLRLDERIRAPRQKMGGMPPMEPWRIHDLRRTFATGLGEDLGIQPHVVEAALNHFSGAKRGVAGTYNKSKYQAEVRNALALWAEHVRAIADGGERKVLPMRAGAA